MNKILADTQNYITGIFTKNHNEKLRYHNLRHTKNVVKAAEKIGRDCGFSGEELTSLLVAAWFHDVGYLECIKNHEEVSKQFAVKFLAGHGISDAFIKRVEMCIDATKLPQEPKDKLAAVLCDADLYHIAQDGFMDDTQIFWDENAAMNGEDMNEKKYLERTLDFLNKHEFQTSCCRKNLAPGKQANITKVKSALEKL
jgi:predicted metal-dependent HD superfamily phosphohydrolase